MNVVYVIGYNGQRWLPECIRGLPQVSRCPISLILIDNHNNAGLSDLALCRPEMEVVKTPRKMGFADAHNFGIVAAPPAGELVVLLNQDTKSGEGWLDECAEAFAADPGLGVVMPGLRTYDDGAWDENFVHCAGANPALAEWLGSGRGDEVLPQRCYPVPLVTGAAMVVRTQVLWEVGLFDPIFESYYEDYDFCRRASRAGWGIGICPAARVFHYQGSATSTPEARRRRERWIARNRVIERVREAGAGRAGALLRHFALEFPRDLLRSVVRSPSSRSLRATLGAEVDLWRLLPRLISASRDAAEWERHLESISWPRGALRSR